MWTDRLARTEQIPTEELWNVWLYLAGRGAGKTRTAAEWVGWEATKRPKTRWAVVAATFSDVRDTCAEGESGLVSMLKRYGTLDSYNRSIGEIRLTNGSRIKLFSAAEPDRLRGPQFHGAWCDELAAWDYPDTWDQLQFGLRLGEHPRTIVTTTPRPVKVIRDLLDRTDGSVHVVRGSTFDNAKNLAPSALAQLRARYEGTRLGRQELFAELLLDVPGALWTQDNIDANRVTAAPDLDKLVIAIDPATTESASSDETGIIVVGRGVDGRAYTLKDASCRLPIVQWAQRAIDLFDEFQADLIVGEVQGTGSFLETVMRQLRPTIPFRGVPALRAKILRAQPTAALWEQNRCSHVGYFAELEDQMVNYTGESGEGSPDRLDAYVHGVEALNIGATIFDDWLGDNAAPEASLAPVSVPVGDTGDINFVGFPFSN